jgi:hypothetical protein
MKTMVFVHKLHVEGANICIYVYFLFKINISALYCFFHMQIPNIGY